MKQTVLKMGVLLVLGIAVLVSMSMERSEAKSLRDLIQRSPELYTPSQILPGQPAAFTVRGKAGHGVKVILSSTGTGLSLPDGTPLRVGRPVAEASGVIPETGVLNLTLEVPDDSALLGEHQFVEAISWPQQDSSQVEVARIFASSGTLAADNTLAVGTPADGGATIVVPGDAMMGSLMRSLDSLNDIRGDERKRQLIDDGKINRDRLIDQNLTTPLN